MLSLFLASMEGTVVATAMPTIVAQMGGLSIYSWVFSIFMLASTTTVPIYGKLSDVYGRKRVYLVSMALLLVGSILWGPAGCCRWHLPSLGSCLTWSSAPACRACSPGYGACRR